MLGHIERESGSLRSGQQYHRILEGRHCFLRCIVAAVTQAVTIQSNFTASSRVKTLHFYRMGPRLCADIGTNLSIIYSLRLNGSE
jgi:hypothetical protein